MKSSAFVSRRVSALALSFAFAVSACGSDSDGAPPTGGDGTEPVYAVASHVFADDGSRSVYITLTKSLDISEFSFEGAREYPGIANMEAIGGRLYVSDGEEPIITQFAITDDLEWIEQSRIGFQGYPLGDNANFFGQYQIDDDTMYLPFDISKRIVWDPKRMEIEAVMEDSSLEITSGDLTLAGAGNRGRIRYDGPTLQAFFYHDEDWYDFGEKSLIAVYDPKTYAEIDVIEGPCPGLSVPSQDEAGNTYFSAWDYTPLFALYGVGPAPCVARVTKDRKLDTAFETDLSSLTGGRHLMNFNYVRDGWGFADVLHHELLDADFEGELDPSVLDQIWEGGAFRLWRIDLANGVAEPYEDVGATGMGWSTAKIDGRTFLFVPSSDWTSTKIYELSADGSATLMLEAEGDVSFIRVR